MMHGGNVWQGNDPAYWLDFSANLRPEGPPNWVKEAMFKAVEDARYYPPLVQKSVQEALSYYTCAKPTCIFPCSGGIQAIDLICQMAPKRIVIQSPTFGEYKNRALANGKECVYFGETAFQADDFVFICNPNNPTGHAYSRDEMMQIYAKVSQARATLVVDEAFIDFCVENSVRSFAQEVDDIIVVGSLTKTLCVPGVRLGYIVAKEETIYNLQEKCAPWSLNCFANAIAKELPQHIATIQEDVKNNKIRRTKLRQALVEMGMEVYPSESNFLLVRSQQLVPFELLQQKGILVRKCSSFGLDDFHMRVAVKTEEDNRRLLEALREVLA